jgi:hypothetical protein
MSLQKLTKILTGTHFCGKIRQEKYQPVWWLCSLHNGLSRSCAKCSSCFGIYGIAVGAQSSHSLGNLMSHRECAGFNRPPLSISAE